MTEPAPARPPSVPRVDAHHHVWDLAVRPQPWTDDLPVLRRTFTFDELVPHLDQHHVDATVIVQTVNDLQETREFLDLAAVQPRIRGVVGWVDLTADDVAERVAELRAQPGGDRLVAIRHQVQHERAEWLARPEVRRSIATLSSNGLAYEFVVTADQLPAVIETVAALPEVRFVLDHGGKPPISTRAIDPWATQVKRLGALPNLVCKFSGLATEDGPRWSAETLRPYFDVLAESFDPSRLIFGSDWPVCLLAGSYDSIVSAAEVLTADWSAADRAEAYGGTAVRAYGLTVAAG